MDVTNPFYTAAVDHMKAQLIHLEELIGRSLTPDEKDNIHEFFNSLDPKLKYEFESQSGPLV